MRAVCISEGQNALLQSFGLHAVTQNFANTNSHNHNLRGHKNRTQKRTQRDHNKKKQKGNKGNFHATSSFFVVQNYSTYLLFKKLCYYF